MRVIAGHMEISQFCLILSLLSLAMATADPEANLLQAGCSTVKSTNATDFQQNLNATLASLLRAVAASGFARAEQVTGTDPVYGLAQCRQDKNSSDCVACITAAQKQIRNCSNVSGGRTIYDGCFLRYESNNFYTQNTAPGDTQICGTVNIGVDPNSFSATIRSLISDLCAATPKTDDFFAAQARKEAASNRTIYGLASCLRSLSQEGCRDCLRGYTAPEYAIHGQLTEKADTYSYGVVVLEIISGRKSIDMKQSANMEYLLEWLYEAGKLLEMVDKRVVNKEGYVEEEVLRMLNLALACIQASVVDTEPCHALGNLGSCLGRLIWRGGIKKIITGGRLLICKV